MKKSQLIKILREEIKQVREQAEMPGGTSSYKLGTVDLDELEEKIERSYGEKGSEVIRFLAWGGDGPVTPYTFISRAFKLAISGKYHYRLLTNIVAEFVQASGVNLDESSLEGPVAGHDYKNPRTPKDIEDLETKGYSKIDKRTPSFKYKDEEGEYTPMMKKLEEENSFYRKMAYHHSGVLSDFIIPSSVTVKDLDDSYRLYFELKVPVAFGYDADEIKTELQGDSYGGPGQSYSHAKTLIKRMGDNFHVKVWVTGGMDV